MQIANPLCNVCKHMCFNNNDGLTCGCRAFPNGIVDEAKGGYNHREIISGQIGNFVYEEANYNELPPFGKYLWDARKKAEAEAMERRICKRKRRPIKSKILCLLRTLFKLR